MFKVVQGKQGVYKQVSIQKKSMTVAAFKNLAESKYKTPHHFDYTSLEKKFWQNIIFQSPLYGADMSGTLTDKDVDVCVGLE